MNTLAKLAGYIRDPKTGEYRQGLATGVGVTALGAKSLLGVLGISAVAHSSGAAILTAGSGYIAGTMGFGATLLAFFSWPLVLVVCLIIGILNFLKFKRGKQ